MQCQAPARTSRPRGQRRTGHSRALRRVVGRRAATGRFRRRRSPPSPGIPIRKPTAPPPYPITPTATTTIDVPRAPRRNASNRRSAPTSRTPCVSASACAPDASPRNPKDVAGEGRRTPHRGQDGRPAQPRAAPRPPRSRAPRPEALLRARRAPATHLRRSGPTSDPEFSPGSSQHWLRRVLPGCRQGSARARRVAAAAACRRRN